MTKEISEEIKKAVARGFVGGMLFMLGVALLYLTFWGSFL